MKRKTKEGAGEEENNSKKEDTIQDTDVKHHCLGVCVFFLCVLFCICFCLIKVSGGSFVVRALDYCWQLVWRNDIRSCDRMAIQRRTYCKRSHLAS